MSTIQGISTMKFDSGGCFLAGTLVSTSLGEVAIESIQMGDSVRSYGSDSPSKVLALIKVRVDGYFEIATQSYTVMVTGEHPFFTTGGLKQIKDIDIGDILITNSGQESVITKKFHKEIAEVYNLSVTEPHTYYANGFVVHNKP